MQRTVSIKLNIENDAPLRELAVTFAQVLNDICDVAWEERCFAHNPLHYLVYYPMREKYVGLKANHVACAVRMVSSALKAGRTVAKKKRQKQTKPIFSKPTIGFDMRTSKITADHCTLSTLGERIRVDYSLSPYQSQFFDGTWKIGGSKLVLRKKGWFLQVSVSKEVPPIRTGGNTIGIDQGIRQIAVTSDNRFFPAGKLNLRTAQMKHRRGELQSKGTPSARKRLKSISRRENRFRTDVLRCTVKSILSTCDDVDVVVLEDLTKIEGHKGRNMNRKLSNWGFAQFRDILTYKAEEIGIRVETVDARYTSQKCSACGLVRKANRKQSQHLYVCKCGLSLNDDLNAARTIRNNYTLAISEECGVSVKDPNVTPSCKAVTNSLF